MHWTIVSHMHLCRRVYPATPSPAAKSWERFTDNTATARFAYFHHVFLRRGNHGPLLAKYACLIHNDARGHTCAHAHTHVLLQQASKRGAPFSVLVVVSAPYNGENPNKVPCQLLVDATPSLGGSAAERSF